MRNSIVLISFLCCISMYPLQVSAGKVTASVHNTTIPNLDPFYSISTIINGTFIYVLCNDTAFHHPIAPLNCRVAVESAESFSSKSCNVTLDKVMFFNINLSLLTPDKAILLWLSGKTADYPYATRVINVLDFKDNCRLHETRLRLRANISIIPEAIMDRMPVVPYGDGTFDVFYENSNICDAGSLCKIRFNNKAEKISEGVQWFDVNRDTIIMIFAIWPRSPAYGYLFNDYAQQYSQVSYVDGKGHIIPLRNYTWSTTPQPGVTRPTHSTAHNLLTLCRNTPVTCEQVDLSNNNTVLIPPYVVNPELPMVAPSINLPRFTVHSLQGGGFLLLQGTSLNRFNAKGEKAGAVEVEGLDCPLDDNKLITNVFENNDGKYCVSLICYKADRFEIHGNVQFGEVCFSNENFL